MSRTPGRPPLARAALCLCVAFAACSETPVAAPEPLPALDRALIPAEEPVGTTQDDYWTERFGDYLSRPQLERYWETPEDRRFSEFGLELLEHRLREDLLRSARGELTQEQVERFRAQPSYAASKAYLDALLAGD